MCQHNYKASLSEMFVRIEICNQDYYIAQLCPDLFINLQEIYCFNLSGITFISWP